MGSVVKFLCDDWFRVEGGDMMRFRFKVLVAVSVVLMAGYLAGCGSGEGGGTTVGHLGPSQPATVDQDGFIRAKKAQIAALRPILEKTAQAGTSAPDTDILIADFEHGLMYSESTGLRPLVPSNDLPLAPESGGETTRPAANISAQANELDIRAADEGEPGTSGMALRRVPTRIADVPGIPNTTIQALVTLPKSSDLDWIDESGEAAYNFLGLQWRFPNPSDHRRSRFGTLDAGLQSDQIPQHTKGRWYAFAYTRVSGGTQGSYPFSGWPSGGIPGESTVALRLQYLTDITPSSREIRTASALISFTAFLHP
jgi:hypothetical protein